MSNIYFKNMINILFELLYFLILARLLFSFLPVDPYNLPFLEKILRFIYQVTEPFLAPFRQLIPHLRVGSGAYIDFSPILALLVLGILRRLLLGLL
ncbi:MAG: YggT family protein [Dethiobacteria bacterium]